MMTRMQQMQQRNSDTQRCFSLTTGVALLCNDREGTCCFTGIELPVVALRGHHLLLQSKGFGIEVDCRSDVVDRKDDVAKIFESVEYSIDLTLHNVYFRRELPTSPTAPGCV